VPETQVRSAATHLDELRGRKGDENLYVIRRELRSVMDREVGVFRNGEGLGRALKTIKELRARSLHAPVVDQGAVYNSNLFHALELENLLDLAEVTVSGAIARQESRGAHARRDFAVRDDERWLKHTLAFRTDAGPRLDYKPVVINTWKPVERKY